LSGLWLAVGAGVLVVALAVQPLIWIPVALAVVAVAWRLR